MLEEFEEILNELNEETKEARLTISAKTKQKS